MKQSWIRALRGTVLALCTSAGAAHAALFIGIASDRDGQALPNVVMALKPIGAVAPATAAVNITVTQEALAFKPYVTAIRSGSSVIFANRDQVEHHIKSFSSSKPFEIAVHKPGDTPAPIRFEKEGAVVAYCILHDWMRAYVYVADTPWFAVSDANGFSRVENIPPGDYEVSAWHPDLGQYKPPLVSKVTVAASGTTQTTVRFEFKPRTVRQAPKTGGTKTAELHPH